MRNKIWLIILLLFISNSITAQVQVSKEPFHKPVFQNKYIRILDVVVPPGDTTQFHIHSTPSLFVYFTNTNISQQIKGKDWFNDQTVMGKVRYTAYSPYVPDMLIHRVTNRDSLPFHVNDIEILSSKDTVSTKNKPLPLPVVFENERSFAYRVTDAEITNNILTSRGPLIIELVSGDKVFIKYAHPKEAQEIKAGKFLYIEPNTSFAFIKEGTSAINMIVFEIK